MFPHFLRPIVGDTDLQILGDFRSGFPFSAVTEAGTLGSLPDALRFPFYGTVVRGAGAAPPVPRYL